MVMPLPLMVKSTYTGALRTGAPVRDSRRIALAAPPVSKILPAVVPVKPICTGSLSVTVRAARPMPAARRGRGRSPVTVLKVDSCNSSRPSASLILSSTMATLRFALVAPAAKTTCAGTR